METSPSSFLDTDGEKNVLANEGAAKLYRAASTDDLIDVPILDMIHPDDRPVFLSRRREALDRGPTSSLIEQRRYALDGTEITVETCALPITWQGKPAILHLQNDITDRKQREIIDRRMATIVESSSDGIIGYSAEGVITNWNLGAENIYGYATDEAIGRSIFFLAPEESRAEESLASKLAPNAQGETVLVVEDDRDVRDMTIAMLERLDCHTLQCPDGKSALEILKTESDVRLLFTDIVLPGGMSGPELARIVQADRPDIGILFTSGYTEDAMQQQGWLDEGVELLNKPFHKADLAQKIRAAIDNSNS